ncbi:hypothetical protein Cch01nite_12790 [Cellulomonas chitinilytica]|uniref:Uncharacterized protein n=1 Tax=Cellulomonas chitinilytica TaxID=398759 RepID=A0A919TYG0_9CELL|nr:hypothetical protein [Cellulomonas chitinilytica]GIG20555.1 hypothetical protein Cch01nite_12790 [Cellulomonas chitinilytica]
MTGGFEVDQDLLRALARSYEAAADGITGIRTTPTDVTAALPGALAGTAADPAADVVRDAFGSVARRHEDLATLVRGTSGRYDESEARVVDGLGRLSPPAPASPRLHRGME